MDKNYYLNENIGTSGISEVRNPALIRNDYNPFESSWNPTNINVGQYFTSDSRFDEGLGDINAAIQEGRTVEGLRADSQSGWGMAGNALVNHLTIAGTTAISGTLGTVWGLLQAAVEQDASKIWDNAINNWSVNVQEDARESFAVHRNDDYNNKSLWEKLGTGVFWADAFINMGFTTGMMIPGMATGALLSKAPALAAKVLPSFIASIGEGSIEAVQSKNDEIKNKTYLAQQEYQRLLQEAKLPEDIDRLNQSYESTLQNIENDAIKAGNFVLGSNIALLTASNAIQWGNIFSRGFGTAKQMQNAAIRTSKGLLRDAEGNFVKESLGKETAKAVGRTFLRGVSEAGEETGQAIIQKTPSQLETYNTFNNSEFNPEKRELVTNWMEGYIKATAEAMEDPATAEAAAMGFITGFLGVPMVRKAAMPIYMQNSVFQEVANARQEVKKRNELVDNINNRLAEDDKINTYYNGLVRHLVMQDRMNTALDNNDIFDYKNAESAQFISDVMMFDDAGALDTLNELIHNSIDTSDEGIQSLIQETSKDGIGPFMQNGNPISNDEVRSIIEEKQRVLGQKINHYSKLKEDLEQVSPVLSQETIKQALFLGTQKEDLRERLNSVSRDAYSEIRQLFESYIPPTKISKGEGVYYNVNGKKKLYRKSDIDHIDENGVPVLKDRKNPIPNVTESNFLEQWDNDDSFKQKVLEALRDDNYTLSEDKRNRLVRNLNDLYRIAEGIHTYRELEKELFKDPNKADSIREKVIKDAEENYKKKRTGSVIEKIKQAQSSKDVEYILNNLSEEDKKYTKDALNTIKDSEDEDLKNIISDYTSLKDAKKSVKDYIDSIEDTKIKTTIENLVNPALEGANNLDDVKGLIEIATALKSDLTEEEKTTIAELLEKISDDSASKKASKKDTNKPKDKVKKKKKSLDLFSDNQEGDIEERERETSKKEKNNQEESQSDTIEELENTSDDELQDIVKGNTDLDVEESDKPKVKKLAKAILNSRKGPKSAENSEDTITVESEPKRKSLPSFRSWVHTKYKIGNLKDRDIRHVELYNSAVSQALDALGAYDFVDKGYLGILFNSNENIPIHYITTTRSNLENYTLLAVEINDSNRNLVDTSHVITGQDGKQYQIVGALGYDSSNAAASDNFVEVREILQEEYKANTKREKPDFFVHSLENKIKHIYSGRMVKTIGENTTPEQKPLDSIIDRENIHLGIYYGGRLHTPTLDIERERIAPLNENNQNKREGSVWLLTREADGTYYAKAVKVTRFNEDYVSDNPDSDIYERVYNQVGILMNSNKSDYDRALAKYAIMELLYIPEDNNIVFNGDAVSILGVENNIGRGEPIESAVDAFIESLYELNPRFQVATSQLTEETYIDSLLNNGILTTDLALAHNINASFDLYLHDLENNTLIENNTEDSKIGHTGTRGINNTITSAGVSVGGKTYQVTDTEIKYEGKVIKNQKTIAEIRFQQQIDNGEINPIEGSSNLCIGTYLDGTEFGIINGQVKRGKSLDALKKKAIDKDKKASKKKEASALISKKKSKTPSQRELDALNSMYDEDTSEELTFVPETDFEEMEESDDFELGFESTEDISYEEYDDLSDTVNEVIPDIKEEKKETKKRPISLSDNFMGDKSKSAKNLKSKQDMWTENRIREYVATKISDFQIDYFMNKQDVTNIKTQEDLDRAIEEFKECFNTPQF